MREAVDLSVFVLGAEDGSEHMDLAVEGVGCAGCIRITTGVVEHTQACLAALEEVLCARA